MRKPNDVNESSEETCGCHEAGCTPLSRRSFINIAGMAATATSLSSATIFAGPFAAGSDNEHLIPADKKLSADWIKSLYERTTPEVFRGQELKYIGMPVGGICCGQLYLGGDGRLWRWGIFDSEYQSNYPASGKGITYAQPVIPNEDPGLQGFAIKVVDESSVQIRELNVDGFSTVSFSGQYPVGRVTYEDGKCPVSVKLEAFSPFIPLHPEDSALPATVMSLRVTNTSPNDVEFTLAGWLRNSICKNAKWPGGKIQNEIVQQGSRVSLVCSPSPLDNEQAEPRKDIVFEDFESERYDGWTIEGNAFGDQPFLRSAMAKYQDVSNHQGNRTANSHNTRVAKGTQQADQLTGQLSSAPFTIQRKFIHFLICGGRHPTKTCINLLVDGKTVSSVTGHDSNRMRSEFFDVTDLAGTEAQLVIVDQFSGGWGNIGIDQIVFSDNPLIVDGETLPGYGTMALSLLDGLLTGASASLPGEFNAQSLFDDLKAAQVENCVQPFGQPLIGAMTTTGQLQPGESQTVNFLISWWFPNYPNVTGEFAAIQNIDNLQRHYVNRFSDAQQVAEYVTDNFSLLAGTTRLWNETWYDSTLPHWLLDRTFVTLDCLATQTCHWFDNGRFYGWEGVTCCPGTCQHVWNYAQGLARIFPSLERSVREQVDYGIAFHSTGALDYRAESGKQVATDGQCGTIVRAYREHITAPDDQYLRRIWPRVKKSIQFMMSEDAEKDGLLAGKQYNTLDQAWYGPMAWVSSMYLAALSAGEAMALEMGDNEFAQTCRQILDAGQQNIVQRLFNGEYFIHKPDPKFPQATNTNDGCHIDQLFGQSLCCQLGLPRVVPPTPSVSALQSIWKYNFAPDAGRYRHEMQSKVKGGRVYALEGEAGLVMTTWPHGGAEQASGEGVDFAVGYFNECMTGFEYQVAAHMIYEGEPDSELVQKGLAIVRAIHDRYHASRRNPYNEIECGDHYSRAMASFGVFLALCGYDYHGPKGRIRFAPRVSPDNFRAPFIAAEGWGTFSQAQQSSKQTQRLELKWGKLRLKQLHFRLASGRLVNQVFVTLGSQIVDADFIQEGRDIAVSLIHEVELAANQRLQVVLQ